MENSPLTNVHSQAPSAPEAAWMCIRGYTHSRIAQMHNVTQMETRRVLENSRWKDANGTQERVAKVKNNSSGIQRQVYGKQTFAQSEHRNKRPCQDIFSQTLKVSAEERMRHWG